MNNSREQYRALLFVDGVPRALELDTRVMLLDSLTAACTVLLDGKRVRSCLIRAPACDQREVETIEGCRRG